MAQGSFSERVAAIDDRCLPPHLGKALGGTVGWAVQELRSLGDRWGALRSGGVEMPLVGRERTLSQASPIPDGNPARDLAALGEWLVEAGHIPAWLPAIQFAPGHTACSCKVCCEEAAHGQTCELVGVCRAICEAHDRSEFPQKQAVRELLNRRLEVAQALWAIARHYRKDPIVAKQLEVLTLAEVIDRAQALEASSGQELFYAIVTLESIALLVVEECDKILSHHFAEVWDIRPRGRGRRYGDQAVDQHLARGGLEIRPERSSAHVGRKSIACAPASKRRDRRRGFIGPLEVIPAS